MRPRDKFDREIFPRTYARMLGFARILKKNGYIESRKKPNLFYKKTDLGVFFADMRGTDIVPLWEDARPLFYMHENPGTPRWAKKRHMEEELRKLRICRLSWHDEFDPEGLFFQEGGDGYCVVCGKDFQGDGLYCSKQCATADKELFHSRCAICGRPISSKTAVEHHLSYRANKTILICRSCHARIHFGATLPHLKPSDARPK